MIPRRDLGQNSKENDILALFSKDSAVPSGILHKDGKVVPVDVQMASTEATFPHDLPRANRTKTAPEAQAPSPVNIKVFQTNVDGGGSKFKRPHSLARDHNASVVVVCELKTSKEQQGKLKKDRKELNLQSPTRQLLKGEKREVNGPTQRRLWLCLAKFVRGSNRFPHQFGGPGPPNF